MVAAAPRSCGHREVQPGPSLRLPLSAVLHVGGGCCCKACCQRSCFECLPVVTVRTLSAWWPAQEAGAVISDAAGNPLDFSQGRFFPWLHGGIVAATPRQASVPRLVRAVSYEHPLQSALPLAACPCRSSSSPLPGPFPLQHACCHHEGAPQHSFARTGAAAAGVGVQPLPGPAGAPGRLQAAVRTNARLRLVPPPHVALYPATAPDMPCTKLNAQRDARPRRHGCWRSPFFHSQSRPCVLSRLPTVYLTAP